LSDGTPAGPTQHTDQADDCPQCGVDLAVHRVLYAGLLLLCTHCLTEVPPAPASAWGPVAPGRIGNWPAGSPPGARLASRATARPRRIPRPGPTGE
jgi:hypothetical protein